jgi:hypothetical protein
MGIAWEEWGERAFKRAKAEDKPILLSIAAKWCHWCHVMDSTTYSDPEVIELIKEKYVPVRVDNDRRPDINRRYNMGGWPSTVFLTPEGDILTGETYLPPESMKALLNQVYQLYKEKKKEIYKETAARKRRVGKPRHAALDEAIIDEGLLFAIDAFDPEYGGFGREPKFPHPATLTFCLKQHYLSKRAVLRKIVTKTLDAMATGGMYDHVEGGFFRYSTTRDWSVPHYEKMLEDNASLARLYLEAYQVFKEEKYRGKALDVLRYLSKSLTDERGGFYGSQDADEEYYKLGPRERKKRKAPFIDRTVFTGWNGLAASAHLYAYALTGRKDYLKTSLKALNRLLRKAMIESGELLHHLNGKQSLTGLLEDHVYFSQALLDAYQITGEYEYLEHALELVGFMVRELWGEEGFYDITPGDKALGLLKQRQKPFFANSDAASLLLDLSLLTGEQVYREYAGKTLRFFASEYSRYGFLGGSYFLAVAKYFAEPLQLSVVGSAKDKHAQRLLTSAHQLYHPFKFVQLLDPERDIKLIQKKGLSIPEAPTLYPCLGTRCLMPIAEADEIPEALSNVNKIR